MNGLNKNCGCGGNIQRSQSRLIKTTLFPTAPDRVNLFNGGRLIFNRGGSRSGLGQSTYYSIFPLSTGTFYTLSGEKRARKYQLAYGGTTNLVSYFNLGNSTDGYCSVNWDLNNAEYKQT